MADDLAAKMEEASVLAIKAGELSQRLRGMPRTAADWWEVNDQWTKANLKAQSLQLSIALDAIEAFRKMIGDLQSRVRALES